MSNEVEFRRRSSLRHLVLVGGGPAHMFVLRQLAQARPGDLKVSLVAGPSTPYQPMLARCLSGQEEIESMDMPLTALGQAYADAGMRAERSTNLPVPSFRKSETLGAFFPVAPVVATTRSSQPSLS